MCKDPLPVPSKKSIEILREAKKKHPNLFTPENILASIREDIKNE